MFNIMDLASKYLDIDKLTAGMSRNYSKSESSEESYVVKKSRRKMKKKPKTKKKKIIIIKKKLQIPEPPKIIIVPQRVRRIKTSKSSVAKISSTSTKGNKKPIKTNSEKIKKKDLESKSSLPGQKGDNKKSPKKTSSVQKALKEFTKRKSQFLESLKLLQEHLSNLDDSEELKSIKSSSSDSSSCILSEIEIPKIEPLPEPKTFELQKPKEFEFYKLYEPKPIDQKVLEMRLQRVNQSEAKTIFKKSPKVKKQTKNASEIIKNSTKPFILDISSESSKTCQCNIKTLKNKLPPCTVYTE